MHIHRGVGLIGRIVQCLGVADEYEGRGHLGGDDRISPSRIWPYFVASEERWSPDSEDAEMLESMDDCIQHRGPIIAR